MCILSPRPDTGLDRLILLKVFIVLQVFSEVKELVMSSTDGYNICIFAYGQTGSGKTFTMEVPVYVHVLLLCKGLCIYY